MRKALSVLCLLTSVATAEVHSPIPKADRIDSLLEGSREINTLSEIERRGLSQGETGLDLWSGSYWPHFQGLIASRYRDPEYASLIESKAQFKQMKAQFDILKNSSNVTDDLSPAEKYDLIIGDSEMSLTNYSWEIGEKVKKGDTVSTWRGLCDGWASAAQMMPRPVRPVTLNTPSGEPVTFFPEDIKALGSLLYARAQGAPIFLGKRCISPLLVFTNGCDEINPGAFHLALVNRVGEMKKSFIADIAPGGEVWNYPVKSYEFIYKNVFTGEESSDFRQVMESYDKKDRKKKFVKHGSRHENTRFIVGVKAKVVFQNMREVNLVPADGSSPDIYLEKIYDYDLELDGNFRVLGGENPKKNLPDFVWAPNDLTYPLSVAEKFNPGLSLVEKSRISAKQGQPLAQIVERLFEEAK